MKLLKAGGRAAVVLPDGTLFGEGIKTRIKEKLLEECNLHTIVRLPKGVFAPYTSIKTNMLFFTKGEPDARDVWFYEHPYPDGREELLEDQADAHRGVRAGEGVVGRSARRPTRRGRSPSKTSRPRLQPRHQEPERARRGAPRPGRMMAEYRQAMADVAETREALKAQLAAALASVLAVEVGA